MQAHESFKVKLIILSQQRWFRFGFVLLSLCLIGVLLFLSMRLGRVNSQLTQQVQTLTESQVALQTVGASLSAQLTALKNEDPRKTNEELRQKIAQVEKVFQQVSIIIEQLADARSQGIKVTKLDKDLAQVVHLLALLDYQAASDKLAVLNQDLTATLVPTQTQLTASPAQDLPSGGSYRRQSVTTDRGTFTISLIAEEIGSVKMITDTANDDTCTNDCPVLPLADYVARNGGFAGINGTYFCPPDYPSCSGQVNSYNTLVFNSRLKKYMNSDQNVYSTVPMVVQNADHSLRFLGRSQEWGRDTGIIGGIANQPLLISGGKAVFTDTGSKGPRGFVGIKGGTLYIGVVHSAAIGDAAIVLQTLGLDSALNLDGGGSSALFYNGKYMAGPGRNLPNAIVLVR